MITRSKSTTTLGGGLQYGGAGDFITGDDEAEGEEYFGNCVGDYLPTTDYKNSFLFDVGEKEEEPGILERIGSAIVGEEGEGEGAEDSSAFLAVLRGMNFDEFKSTDDYYLVNESMSSTIFNSLTSLELSMDELISAVDIKEDATVDDGYVSNQAVENLTTNINDFNIEVTKAAVININDTNNLNDLIPKKDNNEHQTLLRKAFIAFRKKYESNKQIFSLIGILYTFSIIKLEDSNNS